MTQTLKQLLQGATIVAAPNPFPLQIAAQPARFALIPELESLDVDTLGAIDSAITKIKELRFVFEHDGNWAALQRLQDELLIELDLFDVTRWNLKP